MTRRPDLPALTGLRFVAAVWVLLFHTARERSAGVPVIGQLIDIGYVGVSLFFVLSGFILVYTYWREDGDLNARSFWWHRVARVVPVYWIAWLAAAPFAISRMNGAHLATTGVLSASLLQAWVPQSACKWNCPGWSLSAEAFFYLTFPLLLVAVRRMPLTVGSATLIAWMAGLALAASTTSLDPYSTTYLAVEYNPALRLPEFVAGMIAGQWYVRGGRLPVQARPWLVGLFALLVSVLVAGLPKPLLYNGLLAPVFLLLILACTVARGPLATRQMTVLGSSSYALYLLHIPAYDVARQVGKKLGITIETNVIAWIAYCVATVILAYVVFRYVEEPARQWLRRRGVRQVRGESLAAA